MLDHVIMVYVYAEKIAQLNKLYLLVSATNLSDTVSSNAVVLSLGTKLSMCVKCFVSFMLEAACYNLY